MRTKILLLRMAYWWGILADAGMATLYLVPNLLLRFMPVHLDLSAGLSYGLINAVPLMIGWTILLFWADRKPLERKAMLLLTLPVVAGYVVVEVYSIVTSLATLAQMLPTFVSQAGMSCLFVFSYLNAKDAGKEQSAQTHNPSAS